MSYIVQEDELNETNVSCLVCGAENFNEGRIVLQLQDMPHVLMQECPRCKVVSANPMPNNSYLNKLYNPEIYQSSLTHNDNLSRKCVNNILSFYQPANNKIINLLDFGGGNGNLSIQMLQALKRKYGEELQIKATIVDIYPRENTTELEFITVEEFMTSGSKYDIVIASAVLEHIPKLEPVLTKLFSIGKKGALFYSRTPYEVPLAKYIPKYSIKWPRHVHDMGPIFWQKWTNMFPVEVLCSRTSIVESSFSDKPVMTLLAHLLKLPSILETEMLAKLFRHKQLLWHFVGGWEVFIRLSCENTD